MSSTARVTVHKTSERPSRKCNLLDKEYVKKMEEAERRNLRQQQVKSASNALAKTIRSRMTLAQSSRESSARSKPQERRKSPEKVCEPPKRALSPPLKRGVVYCDEECPKLDKENFNFQKIVDVRQKRTLPRPKPKADSIISISSTDNDCSSILVSNKHKKAPVDSSLDSSISCKITEIKRKLCAPIEVAETPYVVEELPKPTTTMPRTEPRAKFSEITDFISKMQVASPSPSVCAAPKECITKMTICAPPKVPTATKSQKKDIKTPQNVIFYDYNNKFENARPSTVTLCSRYAYEGAGNAFDNAAIDRNLNAASEQRAREMRERIEKRCQKAIEKEKIQMEYNNLNAKLDALTQKRVIQPTDLNLCSFEDMAAKQAQMNNAFEEILRKNVIITSAPNPTDFKLIGSGFKPTNRPNLTENSSGSCSSIILERIERKDKAEKPARSMETGLSAELSNSDKLVKLHTLLQQINGLRSNLIGEVLKLSKVKQSTKKHARVSKKSTRKVLESRILDRYKNKDRLSRSLRKSSSSDSAFLRVSKLAKASCAKKPQIPKSVPVRPIRREELSQASSGTSYCSLPDKITTPLTTILKNKTPPQPKATAKAKDKTKPDKVNPLLANYIQRLLGMPRSSIDNLAVSSSDVTTPGSSVINATSNWPDEYLSEKQKIIELQSFIEEAAKEKPAEPVVEPKKPETKVEKQKLVSKYSDLTATCEKRIEELTGMIDKVRKEKQKILDLSVSSGRNSTRYFDTKKQSPRRQSAEKPKYRKFLSFDEYAKQHNLDISKLDSEHTTLLQNGFQDFIQSVINDPEFQYKEFQEQSRMQTLDKSQIDDFREIINNLRLSMAAKDFASKSKYLLSDSSLPEKHESTSSSDTIPDIASELQRRAIISRPFRGTSTNNSKTEEEDVPATTTSLCSPPERLEANWEQIESSAVEESGVGCIADGEKNSTKNSSSEGKPLNLREFLLKELTKRTDCTMSSTDESITNTFLNQILGQMTPSPKEASSHKQKTSTPVPSHSQSSSTATSGTSKLFSGESRLSSVHCNETTLQ